MQHLGAGLANSGHVVFMHATAIDGQVVNSAGAAVTAREDVTFNDQVSGAGGFYGPGAVTFNGGFSPGASAAVVSFEGDATLGDDNTLVVELGGVTPGAFDRLEVAGFASIDGDLDVRSINSYTPSVGDAFGFLFAGGGFGGTFDSLLLPSPAPARRGSSILGARGFDNVVAAPVYSADFDEDGDVDAADLAQWQGDLGLNGDSDADGDGDSDGAIFLPAAATRERAARRGRVRRRARAGVAVPTGGPRRGLAARRRVRRA